ncbi:hypothetical protein Tco_1461518 [Tanacetum coccineum]
MEMEPDIENMTLDEYREYEAEKESNKVEIDSMTIAEYNLYIARQNKNPLNDHSCSFTTQFFAQPPNTPNTPVDKKDFDFDEILDDLFRIGAKKLTRMGKEKVQNGCNFDTSRDTNHESDNLLKFPIFPTTNEFSSICEQDVDLEKEEAEVEDDYDGDTYDIWDITVEDVERISQFLMPNVPDEMDEVIQPLIPQPIHTTPPNANYVAPTTKLNLDELLEEFDDEIVNVSMVDEEAAKDPQSHFTEIQVHSVITKPEPFIHTQPLSPLCGVSKMSKPCKVMHKWWCLDNKQAARKHRKPDELDALQVVSKVSCDIRYCSRKQTWSMA